MQPRNWLLLFAAALAINLLAVNFQLSMLQYLSKPLIMIGLLLYAYFQLQHEVPLRRRLLAALAFSWMGDVWLMFQDRNGLFFIFGLVSFLLAHISYILFFSALRKRNPRPAALHFAVVLGVGLYIVYLLRLLYPHLGDLKIPVILYAVVLGGMFMSAVQAFPRPLAPEARMVIAGALLFVISDSLLAVNRFYARLPQADVLIMLSYGLAQLALVFGSVNWLRSGNNR